MWSELLPAKPHGFCTVLFLKRREKSGVFIQIPDPFHFRPPKHTVPQLSKANEASHKQLNNTQTLNDLDV